MAITKIDAENVSETQEPRIYQKETLIYEKENLVRDISMLNERIAKIDLLLNVLK